MRTKKIVKKPIRHRLKIAFDLSTNGKAKHAN
jgi:hypothetical protein